MTDMEILDTIVGYEIVIKTREHVPAYLLTMIPKMREMIADLSSEPYIDPSSTRWIDEANRRREKLHRWLGFMQGVLWACGIYTIDELKRHNQNFVSYPELP